MHNPLIHPFTLRGNFSFLLSICHFSFAQHFCTLGRDISLATTLVQLAARKLTPTSSPPPPLPGLHKDRTGGLSQPLDNTTAFTVSPNVARGDEGAFHPVGPLGIPTDLKVQLQFPVWDLAALLASAAACLVLGPLHQVAGAGQGWVAMVWGRCTSIHACFPIPSRKVKEAVQWGPSLSPLVLSVSTHSGRRVSQPLKPLSSPLVLDSKCSSHSVKFSTKPLLRG